MSATPRSALHVLLGVVVVDLIGYGIVMPILPYLSVEYGAADASGIWVGLMLSGYAAAGGPADVGWTAYPPNSELAYSTTTGTDLWIVGLALTGVASILGAINFVATTYTRRAPGMSLLRVPIFTVAELAVMAPLPRRSALPARTARARSGHTAADRPRESTIREAGWSDREAAY